TVKDVRIVSAAFETGVDLDLLAALQLRQRHFDRPLDHPGDAQPIRVLGDLGLVVVMNDVEIANRRVEGFDMARVEEVDGSGCDGRRHEAFRNVGERYEHLVLGEREPGPERHPRRRRQSSGREAALQEVSTVQVVFRRHDSSPFVLFEAGETSGCAPRAFRLRGYPTAGRHRLTSTRRIVPQWTYGSRTSLIASSRPRPARKAAK